MLVETFTSILKKEKKADVVPFLKSLDKPGRKEVATSLKTLTKEYFEFKAQTSITGTSFKQKATPDQQSILYATAFALYNRKDYERLDTGYQILTNPFLDEILEWQRPDWFGDMVNGVTKRDWMPWHLTYDMVMTWTEKGHLDPSHELLARLIPQMIFVRNEKHVNVFTPQSLVKRKITCDEHIWLVFSYETTINHADRFYNQFEANKEEKRWMDTLKRYTDNGNINRERLLKESLLATGRNFTKPLSGWFAELFELMGPTQQELLKLQPELLNVLSSQNSKAVNLALNALKQIAEEKEFNVTAFLDNTPILLSSETKSVVSSTLTLLEKIGRKIPSSRLPICHAACQAFIHNDEKIQQKTSKLILKFYEPSMSMVNNEVSRYQETMLMSSRKVLAELITPVAPEETATIQHVQASYTYQPVQEITTVEELIFLASQAFDNNDAVHIDLLPAGLVNLQDLITGAELPKLEPALQRAYSTVMDDWRSTMGYLDHLLAAFFIDVTKLLIEKFPAAGESLRMLHVTFKDKDRSNVNKWSWYQSRIPELHTWSVQSRDNTYIIHKALLLIAYEKIKMAERQPILSTPTHQYGYIDPLILVQRIKAYQEKNVLPDNLDFQVAISRIAPFNHAEALIEARKVLNGETLRILEFLFDKDAKPLAPFTTESLWFVAAFTKSPQGLNPEFSNLFYSKLPRSLFTGDVSWKTFTEHYKTSRYNYKLRKYEDVPDQRVVLKVNLNPPPSIWQEPENKKTGLLSTVTNFFKSPKAVMRREIYLLYEYLSLKAKYITAENNDVERFISLFPSNPNPILALVTARSLASGSTPSEIDKRLVTKTLESLINRTFCFSEITHLFISACMVSGDKTVKSLAAEIWIAAVTNDKVDNGMLGKMIGTHLGESYAPMKRFTDLITGNLLKISRAHDRALEAMIGPVIENLPNEAPVGTKRLLELYSEILSSNASSPSSEKIKDNLKLWSAASGGMKKTIEVIIANAQT